jgi:hypothetical protein
VPRTLDRLSLGAAGRTVWLFGAGASACSPYDVPIQAGVLRHFAKMLRPGPPRVQQDLKDLRQRVREHCKSVLPGLALEDDGVTLEELFSAYELALEDPRSTTDEARPCLGCPGRLASGSPYLDLRLRSR